MSPTLLPGQLRPCRSLISSSARLALTDEIVAWWVGRVLTTGTLCAHTGLSAGYKGEHEQQKAG
jgi:hypothetical protein